MIRMPPLHIYFACNFINYKPPMNPRSFDKGPEE